LHQEANRTPGRHSSSERPAIRTRVWGAGKLIVLAGALLMTYLLFAAAAMRVALRSGEVTVPDLASRTINDASALLSNLGLTLKVDDTRRTDARIAAGRIAQQDPPPGMTARRQRSVKVWISSGPRATIVPKLTGETERTAQVRLQQEGLTLQSVAEIRSPDYPPDTIIAQEPPPDSKSATVALLVNRGERSGGFVMPDLIGVNGDRAADLMRGHGFRVAVVAEHPYPGVPPGVVLRQSPAAGFQITMGEPISLEVSR
jgi:eukaryotic-like serine/threonine-protein kinase